MLSEVWSDGHQRKARELVLVVSMVTKTAAKVSVLPIDRPERNLYAAASIRHRRFLNVHQRGIEGQYTGGLFIAFPKSKPLESRRLRRYIAAGFESIVHKNWGKPS